MAESSLYAGEKGGGRIFRIGRLGFDQGSSDLGDVYTGVYRTERVQPAGPGSLVMFRRIAVHLLTSGDYSFTLKVWVDNDRTELATGVEQEFTVSGTGGALREVTREVAIEAEGSHVQVEVSVDSDNVTGLFLIESVTARGRVIRESASRTGETS